MLYSLPKEIPYTFIVLLNKKFQAIIFINGLVFFLLYYAEKWKEEYRNAYMQRKNILIGINKQKIKKNKTRKTCVAQTENDTLYNLGQFSVDQLSQNPF